MTDINHLIQNEQYDEACEKFNRVFFDINTLSKRSLTNLSFLKFLLDKNGEYGGAVRLIQRIVEEQAILSDSETSNVVKELTEYALSKDSGFLEELGELLCNLITKSKVGGDITEKMSKRRLDPNVSVLNENDEDIPFFTACIKDANYLAALIVVKMSGFQMTHKMKYEFKTLMDPLFEIFERVDHM
jgi:hypothetical protein